MACSLADTWQVPKDSLPDGAAVLVPDDFTNSGSTLFGAGSIIRKHASGTLNVAAFVSHFVAKYDKAVVDKFVAKLYSEGEHVSDLDHFYTTDTVGCSTRWLSAEVGDTWHGIRDGSAAFDIVECLAAPCLPLTRPPRPRVPQVEKRDGKPRCTVMSVAPVIATWLSESGVALEPLY